MQSLANFAHFQRLLGVIGSCVGIKPAAEAFQQLNENNFKDIEGTAIYIDDIIIFGKTLEEHDNALKKIVDRARKENIRFNSEKIQFRIQRVTYWGI